MVARFALAALIVFAVLLRGSWRCTRSEFIQGLGVGIFGGLGMVFQVDGLGYTTASTSAFLTQGTVITIPIAKALLHHELPSRRAFGCVLLALIGVAVLSQLDLAHLRLGRGEAETLIAALFFTGHILWLERPSFTGNDSRKVSLVMFATIAVITLPMIATKPILAVQSLSSGGAWLCLAVLIGPCTLGSFLWMNRWQPFVSATTAGLIYCLEPVFASVFALVLPGLLSLAMAIHYPNESVTLPILLGGGLILLANVFMQWPAPKDAESSRLNEHGI
jgi:drug/metabolite transporter (DMT)-like permease